MSSVDPSSVALVTPTYDGKLGVLYVLGLTEVIGARLLAHPYFQAGCSNVALARNRCVHWFLKTPFTELVFVDADIGFRLTDWQALLEEGSDAVCAPYRKKDQRQAVKVHMGLGFARVSRSVFTAMADLRTEDGQDLLHRFRMDGEEWIDYFPQGVEPLSASWRGEDHGFWLFAKLAGASVRIEERCRLVHSGEAHWVYRSEDFPDEQSPFGLDPDITGGMVAPGGEFPEDFQGI